MDQTYTVEQLVADDGFLAYVLQTDPEAVAYWTRWLAQHPEHRPVAEEATRLIQWMTMQPEAVSQATIEQETQKLETRLAASTHTSQSPVVRPLWRNPLRVAASLVLLLTAAVAGWFLLSQSSPETVSFQTQPGESRMVLLPDSSVVFMSEASSLRYASEWKPGSIREVWLEGEAFFHVRPKPVPGGVKFQVHASLATIEVLGTRFNVWNRRQKTKVVLNSGKVRVNLNAEKTEPIFMIPGEMVEVMAHQAQPVKSQVNPALYPPQKGNKIVFSNTPVQQVAVVIEEYYGLKVQMEDPALASLKISGTLPTNNEESFLKALSVILDVNIIKQSEKQILFQYNR